MHGHGGRTATATVAEDFAELLLSAQSPFIAPSCQTVCINHTVYWLAKYKQSNVPKSEDTYNMSSFMKADLRQTNDFCASFNQVGHSNFQTFNLMKMMKMTMKMAYTQTGYGG